MAMHNHNNNRYTIGLGEFTAVMNGFEFRTRHNDYPFMRRTADGEDYEYIEAPQIPPSVLEKETIPDQIEEMREYFKAFKTQNKTHRDYTDYFKANLCYLEGAWYKTGPELEESFKSDRHFIDAETWAELFEKIEFNANTGAKDSSENLAYLPTQFIEMINGTIPSIAQWNYKILCHPLKDELALDRFELIDDIQSRMADKSSITELLESRKARFTLNARRTGKYQHRDLRPMLIDDLMYEVITIACWKISLNIIRLDLFYIKNVCQYSFY